MKTEYEILWVDDDMESVQTDQDDVGVFLQQHGIKANIRPVTSFGDGEIHNEISNVLADPELDLIVVDYLMDGIDGARLIDLIRTSDHIFLPVVFYSSSGVDRLMEAVRAQQLDGVYLANRNGVRNKVEMVVTSLLRKEQTSKRARGLLMEGVSEIDANCGKALARLWGMLDGAGRGDLIKYFKKQNDERAKSTSKRVSDFPSEEAAFWTHVTQKFVSVEYDTVIRWKVVLKALKLAKWNTAAVQVFHELYESAGSDALIKLRNQYAHQTRAQLEASHNVDICVRIRNELRRQMENIMSMTDAAGDG